MAIAKELKLLENNNTVGQDASARNWFIVGALVLFLSHFF
jgi:hypothetical protein